MTGKRVVVVVAGLCIGAAAAQERVFKSPTHNGYRIDACHAWGQGCGQEAADAFCRAEGFQRAQSFEVDPRIGAVTPTMTLADRRVCDQAQCDGFRTITCVGTATGGSPGAETPPRLRLPSRREAVPATPAPTPATAPPAAAALDPDEFVVIYPGQASGRLARFGSRAAEGQLEEERSIPLKVKAHSFQAEAGDFDGDGETEIALLERTNPAKPGNAEVVFLKLKGSAGFTPAGEPYRLVYGSSMPFLAVGRFFGAGRHQVLVYTPGGATAALNMDPAAGMVNVRWNPKGFLVPIDLTGDGVDEVLDYSESGTLDAVSFGAGGPGAGGELTPVVRPLPAVGPGRRFAVGDFTGNGRQDLLVHDALTGGVSLAQFTEKGSVSRIDPIDTGWTPTMMWTAGRDYDGDKRDDLLVYDPAAELVQLVRFTSTGVLRSKDVVSSIRPETLLYPGFFTATGRASYVAMARDLGNKIVHVQFDAAGEARPDGTLIEQLPDGGVVLVGNFVKGR